MRFKILQGIKLTHITWVKKSTKNISFLTFPMRGHHTQIMRTKLIQDITTVKVVFSACFENYKIQYIY